MTASVREAFSEEEIRAKIATVAFWFHQIEVAPGIVTPGVDRSAYKLQRLNLPADMTGKRVLDIGAFDGFFSFECERRGAEVVAIDAMHSRGFQVAHELLNSRVQFRTMSIYELDPATLGQFDLVLCLGVLYHLRHPMLGLERVHTVCRGELILETHICDSHFLDEHGTPHMLATIAPALQQVPIARFYPGGEYNGDESNWWGPNLLALLDMLRCVGFLAHETITETDRVCVHCTRSEQAILREWSWDNSDSAFPPPPRETEDSEQRVGDVDRGRDGAAEREAALTHALTYQTEQNRQLQRLLAESKARIADLEARVGWLDGQARAARHALAAVEQGRVLRLLRWLTGAK